MTATAPLKPTSNRPAASSVNPFARALAETEQSLQRGNQAGGDNSKLFSDALAQTGGKFDFNQFPGNNPAEAQAQLEKQRKKEALRKKLHDQVNPVDMIHIYNAREEQVKKEIDKLRSELELLVKDVKDFHKEVQLTLMTEVAHPGQDGKYYITFFQQLRTFIMLLRQKIKNAGTWATSLQNKQSKKRKKGMVIGGQDYQKTSTIQDMMHHERSMQYGGG